MAKMPGHRSGPCLGWGTGPWGLKLPLIPFPLAAASHGVVGKTFAGSKAMPRSLSGPVTVPTPSAGGAAPAQGIITSSSPLQSGELVPSSSASVHQQPWPSQLLPSMLPSEGPRCPLWPQGQGQHRQRWLWWFLSRSRCPFPALSLPISSPTARSGFGGSVDARLPGSITGMPGMGEALLSAN